MEKAPTSLKNCLNVSLSGIPNTPLGENACCTNFLPPAEERICPVGNPLYFILEALAVALIYEPLLFETSCQDWLDSIIVATAPFLVQQNRVLARKSMTEEKFQYILSQQMTDQEKRNKADFVVNTNVSLPNLSNNIKDVLKEILK